QLNALITDAKYLTTEKQFPEAISKFEEAIKIKPDLTLAHARLGTALLQAGRPGPAAEEFKLAMKCDPEDPEPHMTLGWMAFDAEGFDESLASARRADACEPYSAEVKYLIGQSLLRMIRLPEAEEAFRKAVVIDPRHPGSLQSLALVLRLQKKAADGVEY